MGQNSAPDQNNEVSLNLPNQTTVSKHDKRSGTFQDNMKLPIHRWFRYSAGFSAEWVTSVLRSFSLSPTQTVLDPFAGSGTVLLAADLAGIPSVGIEAHPFIFRIAKCKLRWDLDSARYQEQANKLIELASHERVTIDSCPPLLRKCYDDEALKSLLQLRSAWQKMSRSDENELLWLTLTSILRACSHSGTAQWQYVLPNKRKAKTVKPFDGFLAKVKLIASDLFIAQATENSPLSRIVNEDSRNCPSVGDSSIDAVVTSPPYANNYDYADATRLEMTFWGEISSWGELHGAVRKYLMCSSSQHASKEKFKLEDSLGDELIAPIADELHEVCHKLAATRLNHGGKKHYHTMVARYFLDITKTLRELNRAGKPVCNMCWVVGDSAPYGIYVPVDEWIGRLALANGFTSYNFEKLRDRNIKWKNRKHRVPLHEGRLWISRE